jgi:hypothetical protein
MNSEILVHRKHELADSLLEAVKQSGICYASVGVIKDNVIYSAFSHPLWQEFYIKNALHLNDPSFKAAVNMFENPVLWDSVPLYSSEAIEVMNNRCNAVGAIGGVTICFAKDNNKLLLTLGVSEKKDVLSSISNVLSSLNPQEVLCSHIKSI